MTLFDPASGLPLALALRIGTIGATLLAARRQHVALPRGVPRIRDRLRRHRPDGGRRAVGGIRPCTACSSLHRASGFRFHVYGGRALRVVPRRPFRCWRYRSRSSASDTSAILTSIRRSVFIGVAFNLLLGAVELVFAADDVDHVPVRVGADDAGDRGARGDRTRRARKPARRRTCIW